MLLNHINIFEILLKRGVDINLPYNNSNKSSPFMVALESKNEYIIERLLSSSKYRFILYKCITENVLFYMGIYMDNLIFRKILNIMLDKNKTQTLYYIRMRRYKNDSFKSGIQTCIHCCIYYLDRCRQENSDDRLDKYYQDIAFEKIKILMNTLYQHDKFMINDFKNLFEEIMTKYEFSFVCKNFSILL